MGAHQDVSTRAKHSFFFLLLFLVLAAVIPQRQSLAMVSTNVPLDDVSYFTPPHKTPDSCVEMERQPGGLKQVQASSPTKPPAPAGGESLSKGIMRTAGLHWTTANGFYRGELRRFTI